MYRRIAAHFIYYNGLFRMHCLELDACGCVQALFPLREETAGTSFYNGIVVAAPGTTALSDWMRHVREDLPAGLPEPDLTSWLSEEKAAAFLQVPPGEPVVLFHAPDSTCASLICLYPQRPFSL